MNKEFVTYEQALALKELGFDEPCFKKYIAGCLWSNPTTPEIYENIHPNSSDCLAPLYSQALRWFREKYKLHQYINQYCGEHFFFNIEDMVHPRRLEEYPIEMLRCFNESFSQEEAESKCLDKLIEIVKKNA